MNQDEIIEMASEAGMVHDEDDDSFFSPSNLGMDVHINDLKRFAALVAAAEREACAKVCDDVLANDWEGKLICAAAIRTRGQA